MEKIIRTIISIVISWMVLYGITSITKNDSIWIAAIVCFCCTYPILYSGRSHHLEQRIVKQEYIIDLHNNKIGDLFVPSNYPGYEKQNSSSDGNDYMSKSGSAICTKFVEKKQTVKIKDSGFAAHLFCILMSLFVFLVCSSLVSDNHLISIFETHKGIVSQNIIALKDNGLTQAADKALLNINMAERRSEYIYANATRRVVKPDLLYSIQGNDIVNNWNVLQKTVLHNFNEFITEIKSFLG